MERSHNQSQYLIDIATKLKADILYARWEGCEHLYESGKPSITERKFKNFLERMGLPDTSEEDLIDIKRLSFEDKKIVLFVRKISEIEKRLKGKKLDEEQYHEVEIRNPCKSTASYEEKVESLYDIIGWCDCPRYERWILPKIKLPSDKHIFLGMNYSSRHLGIFDLGIFNYHDEIIQAEKELIEKMKRLKVNKNWPNYRINQAFPEYGERIFNPLIRML